MSTGIKKPLRLLRSIYLESLTGSCQQCTLSLLKVLPLSSTYLLGVCRLFPLTLDFKMYILWALGDCMFNDNLPTN